MAKLKFEKDLVHNLVQIQNDKNTEKFLDVLLTDSEVEELTNRLQIFKGLLAGKTQREIAEELGVAIGTVIHGARELRNKKDKVKRMIQL
ncbi:MAG: Trp family transcriptional regulator [Candidatus Magasanikbacteria bacterium]